MLPDPKEQMVWDIIYAQVLGIQYHPKSDHINANAQTRDAIATTAAHIANNAILVRRELCLSS